MRISDILSICLRNLSRRKLRTFLTALGVVIGVALIIIAVSIGIGLSVSYEEQLASWGDLTVINVYNYNSNVTLDDKMVAQIQAIDGVQIATPFYQDWNLNMTIQNKNGRYVANPQLYGVYPEALSLLGYEMKEGDTLKEGDKKFSVVVGEQFAYQFRDTKKDRNNYRDPYPDQYGRIKDPFVDVTKDRLYLVLPTQKYDSSGNPVGKDITEQLNVAGILAQSDTTVTYSQTARNPYAIYTDESGARYQVWFEDAQSIADKIDLAQMFGITGFSFWRLGNIPTYSNYNLWTAVQAERP